MKKSNDYRTGNFWSYEYFLNHHKLGLSKRFEL